MKVNAERSQVVSLESFPNLRKFLDNHSVPSSHPIWGLEDRLLRALEFFFSLPDNLPGIDQQKEKFLRLVRGDGRTNEAEAQNAAFWAEIRGTFLLGKTLGATIIGFEQPSPNRQSGYCDIVARCEGKEYYFEVKRKSADARQKIPDLLESELDALGREIGFRLIPKLGDRDYDCAGLTALINDIKAHAANAPRDDRGMPLPFFNEVLEVYFDAVDDDEIRMEYLDPDSPEDIERYALGPRDGKAVLDKDGKPMVPMVDRCRRKGADYLMCQVGFVESAEEAAKACFPEATRLSSMEYETTDSRLSGLKGILFFRTTFDWCIVHNKVTVDCESPQPW